MTCPTTIFGRPACRFEGRYDVKKAPPGKLNGSEITNAALPAFMDALRDTKTYVRDVCVRCGRTIEREGK